MLIVIALPFEGIVINIFGFSGLAVIFNELGMFDLGYSIKFGSMWNILYSPLMLLNSGMLFNCFSLPEAPEIKIIVSVLQFLIASGSWIVIAKIVAETGGTTASAGFQIALRNVVFFIMPAWGLSNAAATLVGQNLGAKQIQRAEKSVQITLKYNAIFMSMVMLLFIFFADSIIRIFTQDEPVIRYAVQSLQIIGAGYIFYGIGMVMIQALNGAGDTRTPTIINFVCFWLFQIPLAYLLAYTFNLKALGAFIAIPIAETLIALIAWYYFNKGYWKQIKV